MSTYSFGLSAEQYNGVSSEDFEVSVNVGGQAQNQNWLGDQYFNDPQNIVMTGDLSKVTSIPSPYARMHITDIAFREMMAGVGTSSGPNPVKGDYLRAMSHCLDIYEMLFHYDELDLFDKGVTIKKIDLVNSKDPRFQTLLGKNESLKNYIETLDLFRDRYNIELNKKKSNTSSLSYTFDFTKMYVFKYKGRTFAASSPFTGFFAKADCDLTEADLSVNGHKLLTGNSSHWQSADQRDQKLLEFLYLLLKKTGLKFIFENLSKAVSWSISTKDSDRIHSLDNTDFGTKYPAFNLDGDSLPQIAGNTQNTVYIRPDGLDRCYLKYLLFLENAIDLTISDGEYKDQINQRQFSGRPIPWIGVNDILSDALFILPYDISKNYLAAEYIDESEHKHRRCLLPIKKEALQYIDLLAGGNITRI